MLRNIKDLAFILFGAFSFAFGINYFAIPNTLSEGGVIGITIITFYLFEWSPALMNFLLNATLLALGYKFFTKRATIYTILSFGMSSFFLYLTEGWGQEIVGDTLLAALFAGIFVGLGIGLMFRSGGTAGGTTILAKMLNKIAGWDVGPTIFVIDVIIILASAFVIGQEKAMYTLIAVYVGSKVIDLVVEGASQRTAVMIISSEGEKVLDDITRRMARGVTVLEGRGGYSNLNKEVLYIVINKREIVQLRKIIEKLDPEAYVTTHRVQEIFKTGYKGGK
ncbi:YitT family protein [Piscibacillus sp. B03]|uniref:YitT family protein n=1 Tax=Piscibacillus sp. B03 TaxID=3457430 RepID=UPI003FCC30E2